MKVKIVFTASKIIEVSDSTDLEELEIDWLEKDFAWMNEIGVEGTCKATILPD